MSKTIITKTRRIAPFVPGVPIRLDAALSFSNPSDLLATLAGLFVYSDVPASSGSYGVPGQRAWDGVFFYECTAPSHWVRLPAASWSGSLAPFSPSVPTSSGATLGERRYNNGFIYECVEANTWVRYPASAWS